MQFERKSEIMDNLLLFAQKESLNEKQKKAFLKIVKELPKGTNLQKERFIMYFGLDKTKGKRKKICEMSKIYNCTASAVRESVMSIRNLLMRMPNEKIEMLQKIMEE